MFAKDMPRVNPDGSRNVFCPRCTHYVGTVTAVTSINTAICAVCTAQDEGADLTPKDIAELRAVRFNGQVMSHAATFQEYTQDPLVAMSEHPEEVHAGKPGYWFKVIARTKFVIDAAVEAVKEAIPQSKQIAKEKRPKRIFDQPIDPDEDKNK